MLKKKFSLELLPPIFSKLSKSWNSKNIYLFTQRLISRNFRLAPGFDLRARFFLLLKLRGSCRPTVFRRTREKILNPFLALDEFWPETSAAPPLNVYRPFPHQQ